MAVGGDPQTSLCVRELGVDGRRVRWPLWRGRWVVLTTESTT